MVLKTYKEIKTYYSEESDGSCNHCGADLDITLVECAGCNMRWCSDFCHRSDDDNNDESFKYGMEGSGHNQLVDFSSRDLLKQIAMFRE